VPYASWNATTVWDPVTGYGTPDFQKLMRLAVRSGYGTGRRGVEAVMRDQDRPGLISEGGPTEETFKKTEQWSLGFGSYATVVKASEGVCISLKDTVVYELCQLTFLVGDSYSLAIDLFANGP
jgi:hypothetical protein